MTSIASRLLIATALVAAVLMGGTPPATAQPSAPPDFVSLADVDPTILQEIRYFTRHNFTGDPVGGYQAPMCNRLLLKDGLEKQRLENYENEWRHFTFKPEAYPETYFDFPIDPSSLSK